MVSTAKYYKVRRAAIVECLGGSCQLCGANKHLEFHHNAVEDQGFSHGIGGWQQIYRLEREISEGRDIMLLCRDCHKEAHKNGGIA